MQNEKTVQYEIYQLSFDDPITKKIRFMSLEEIKQHHCCIDYVNYDCIYQNMMEWKELYTIFDILDSIYTKFNIEIPNDFDGHSLSISDVIVLIYEDKRTAYFVDRVGFQEIPDFFLRKKTDVYPYSYAQAVERAEVNAYMYSVRKNKDCTLDIRKSINENYNGCVLDDKCIRPIIKKYGYARVYWILAYNIQQRLHDGRISVETKEWAKMISLSESIYIEGYDLCVHNGLINSFANCLRIISKE